MKNNAKDSTAAKALPNASVIRAFIMGHPAHSANLSTDGAILRSYHHYEIAKWTEDSVTLRAGGLYSRTTMKHMNLLVDALKASSVKHQYSSVQTPHDVYLMALEPGEQSEPTIEELSQEEFNATYDAYKDEKVREVSKDATRPDISDGCAVLEMRRTLGMIL